MKFPTSHKLAGVAAAAVLATSPLLAEVELTKEIGLSGYVVGSARWTDDDYSGSNSTMDMDAFKLTTVGKFAPVTITASLYAGSDADPVFLDAYGTYDAGGGTTITMGKFLSWLGYEAFDPINMTQLSYANDFTPFIPAYHTGVKVENSTDTLTIGAAILDSVYGPTYYKGDGDLDNGVGVEAYFKLKASPSTAIFGALAWEKNDVTDNESLVADFWAEHSIGDTTFAGEFCWSSTDTSYGDGDGYFWLGFVKQKLDEKWSIIGRISGGKNELQGDAEFLKFTFAPTLTVTKNFEVVGEITHTTFDNVLSDSATFVGLQARFKF